MVSRRHLLKLSALGTASFAAPLAYSASNTTMTHNTGNPIGSTNPKDLFDNAKCLDSFANGPAATYKDRLGVDRKSIPGMIAEFDSGLAQHDTNFQSAQNERTEQFDRLMESSGYSLVGDYGPCLLIERFNQYVMKGGQPYRLSSLAAVPYTTTGDWATESDAFVLLGDDVLRQEIYDQTDPRKGAGMVARAQRMINSIQELAGLTGRYANETIKLASWHAGRNCGGGDLFWSTTMAKSKHDGGMVFSPTVPWTSNIQNYLNGVGESDSVGEGCWVRPDSEYWCEMFGAVPFVNDGRQGIDATIPIQKALYSAKRNAVLLTHSISDLRPVRGRGMFLVQGTLYFPEGVVWEGTDMIATGFAFGWTQTTKISGYGKLHDMQNGNAAGTTFTKNWGLKNMTMAPYYYESGPSSCVYLDLVRDIEPRLQDVRFIMHKGAVKGGQLNATAVRFAKVEDPDFNNITMDGGSNHLYTAFGVEWGVRKARISRAYSYNARDNAVFLASASSKNKIEIEIQMAEQVGSNYGVNIEDGFDNRVDITASGSKLRYGAILNGHDNVVIGTINDALLSTVDVRGEGNQAILSYSGPSPVDTGKNSVIISSKGIKVAGVSQGNKSGLFLTTVNTWYDVAKISFAPGGAAGAVLKASIAMEVVGVDRDCFVGQWLVQTNAAGVVGSTFNVSSKFSASNSIEMQVVPVGSSAANLQIRIVSGTSASGDVQFELSGDNKVTIKAL